MTENKHAFALSDEELMRLAYREDTLEAPQQAHLEQCPLCQQQLATFTSTSTLLRTKLYRSICPGDVNLNYYCLGMASDQEGIRIASHVLYCPVCADEVAEIRRTQAAIDPYPPGAWSPVAALRRVFGALVMQQAQPVTRTGPPGTGWPRQYRAESINLSLHLSRARNGEMLLLGILTSTDPNEPVKTFEGGPVELYSAPGTKRAQPERPLNRRWARSIGPCVLPK